MTPAVRRLIVSAVSYSLLGLAFVLGVIWFFWPGNSRWEPAVNSLTLVAGLTGIFVERLTAEAERRTEVLRAVADELQEPGERGPLLVEQGWIGGHGGASGVEFAVLADLGEQDG